MRNVVLTILAILAALVLAGTAPTAASADPLRARVSANSHNSHGAVRSLHRAAEHGNARAQSRLAYMYWTGRGVPKNYVAAAWWAKRAAEQGEPGAQYLLGLLYDHGHGVPQDYVEAYMWLNLSSARARPPARQFGARIRDAVATKLTYEQLAEAQARSYFWAPVRERYR